MAARMTLARSTIFTKANSLGQPFKNIIMDYMEVSKDIQKDSRNSPVKYIMFLAMTGFGSFLYTKCPSMSDYQSEIIEYSNEIGLCAESTRNMKCKRHVDTMSTMLVDGYLDCVNFGLFSVVVQRPSSSRCHNYHQVCPHLQPRLWMLPSRVLDVGVMGQWIVLEKIMKDFDVNEDL